MRPPTFLSAAAIASLATLGATARGQNPSPAPTSFAPPATTRPTAPPGASPPGAPPSAGAQPPTGPSPGSQPPTPQPRLWSRRTPPGTPPAYGPLPGAQPPGTSPPFVRPAAQPGGPAPRLWSAPGAVQPGYLLPAHPPPLYAVPPTPPALPLDAHSHTGFLRGDRRRLHGQCEHARRTDVPGKVDAIGGAATLEVAVGGALSPRVIPPARAPSSQWATPFQNDTRTSPTAATTLRTTPPSPCWRR
jgi:hypothetical protein